MKDAAAFAGLPADPAPEALAGAILRALESRADPASAAATRRYFKAGEGVEFYGLSAAELRTLEEEAFALVRAAWKYPEALRLCEILLSEARHEARAAGLLVLLRFSMAFPRSLFGRVRRWLASDRLSNWALVDLFCPDGLGSLIRRYPDLGRKIGAWAGHPNRWVKRAAAVSFVKLARRGEFLDETYGVAARLLPSDDDLVQKSLGWLLREAGKTDPRRLERFLRERGPAVPRTALRYAIERFPEGLRRSVMEATMETPGENAVRRRGPEAKPGRKP